MKDRISRIFKNLKESCDCILIKNGSIPYIDYTFYYVTGLEKGVFEGAYVVLYPDGGSDLIIPELESEIACDTSLSVNTYRSRDECERIIKRLLSSYRRVGLNNSALIISDYNKLREWFPDLLFVDISKEIMDVRLTKDREEIERIHQACVIADKTMKRIPEIVTENIREYELASEIDYLLMKYGADKPAFETISSFGVNTSKPHYSHDDNILKKGDFIVCDFGACYKRYNSDITRTFIYRVASKKQREMYEVVREAQQRGLDSIKAGVPCRTIHDIVLSYINDTPFKDRFIHSTGHSLGLSVHDGPGFSSDSKIILKENMVLTVEPGVYIPGYGGVRIEDDILVKKDGYELLTNSTKDLYEL
ncbi:MAG: Xaa-Pro peptidase family protein [Candidatus Thermoplasmatota archaeon]